MKTLWNNPTELIKVPFLRLFLILFPLLVFSQAQVGSDLNGEFPYDFFGRGVALNNMGDIMVVGLPHNHSNPYFTIGRVGVYHYDGSEWQPMGTEIYGTVINGAFGYEVAINAAGTIIAICESLDTNTGNPGNVEVYEFDGNDWVQLGQRLSGVEAQDSFGYSISLDATGTILAVGIPRFDQEFKSGSAYVYHYENGSWEPLGLKINGLMY